MQSNTLDHKFENTSGDVRESDQFTLGKKCGVSGFVKQDMLISNEQKTFQQRLCM